MRALSVARGMPMPSPAPRTRWRAAAPPSPDPLPIRALAWSVAGHVVVVAALVALALAGVWDIPRVHVVNLVSTIAAVGNPAGAPASLPTRTIKPAAPAPTAEPQTHAREAPKPAEPSLPPRPEASRVGDRDLPPRALPSERRAKIAGEPASRPAASALGQVTGSVSGQGALTLDVTDFPYAWYLRQVLQKVEEHWQTADRTSQPAQKPRIYVEIRRDGSIAPPRIEQSSGSGFYDRAALRAITEASPFPPLPADWANPSLRVLFNFDLRRG